MEERQADNKIISTKKEMYYINSQIDNKKGTLKSLDDIHSQYLSINKNISNCIGLIRNAIKGGNINKILDSMEVDNNRNINKATDTIEDDKARIRNELKQLTLKKETLEREMKEEIKEEEKKEKDKK